jgi:hypothetical protein
LTNWSEFMTEKMTPEQRIAALDKILEGVESYELINLLRRRGLVPCVFGPDDAEADIENDADACDFSDEEKAVLMNGLLARSAHRLEDVLSQKGNDYLSDRWQEFRVDLIAEVVSARSPSPGGVHG